MTYFGVNSAAEELQHALQTILADIPGATNIADDILIFAEDAKQRDETLTQVLEWCDSKGITLNLQKSMFSKKGMKSDPQKIQEIWEMPAPENKKALQSFLGLTNYMKWFIHDYSTQTQFMRITAGG